MSDPVREYEKKRSLYISLMNEVTPVLRTILEKQNVSLFNIEGRVKSSDSLRTKLTRKKYLNPMEEIEDFCGIRIICYYESDIDKIEAILRTEYEVTSGSDKQKEIEADRFGYSSRHLICRIKKEWLNVPNYRDFDGLKMEIQVRTMLMHTWAAISHKLLYKRETDAPREIMRSLSKLSALIELADEKFDEIKELKVLYQEKIEEHNLNYDEPLNSDNLASLVEKYSPGRKNPDSKIPQVLEEIKEYCSTVGDFERKIQQFMPYAENMEREEMNNIDHKSFPMWHVDGFCRSVLDITCDEYFNERWSNSPEAVPVTIKYRNLYKSNPAVS